MANCKDCIHYDVCLLHEDNFMDSANKNGFCGKFKNKADVQEVKHCKWKIKSKIQQTFDDVDVYEEIYLECPLCKRTFNIPFEFEDEKILTYARKTYPYCICGTKMDLE